MICHGRGIVYVAYSNREAMRRPGQWNKRWNLTPTAFFFHQIYYIILFINLLNLGSDRRKYYNMRRRFSLCLILFIVLLSSCMSFVEGMADLYEVYYNSAQPTNNYRSQYQNNNQNSPYLFTKMQPQWDFTPKANNVPVSTPVTTVSSSSGSSSSSSTSQRHFCKVCNGSGREPYTWHASNHEVYCDICKQTFHGGHAHRSYCSSCNSKGWW